MTPTSETSLFYKLLPPEIQWRIVWEVIEADSGEGFRVASKKCIALYGEVIKYRWQQLKKNPPPGPIDFTIQMQKIEKGEEPVRFICLFKKLNVELYKSLGLTIPKGPLKVSMRHFGFMQEQKKLQISLQSIWDRIMPEISMLVPYMNNYQEISTWIKTSESKPIRELITRLNLSHSGVNLIPEEINYFPNLEAIDLSSNHIDQLPEFLGSMPQLRIINLGKNRLEKLPDTFPKWVHLTINFAENPLSQSAEKHITEWKSAQAKCTVIDMEL